MRIFYICTCKEWNITAWITHTHNGPNLLVLISFTEILILHINFNNSMVLVGGLKSVRPKLLLQVFGSQQILVTHVMAK